jgi:hypothetical protein
MPNKQAKDAVKQEITKLGAVIIEKTSAGLEICYTISYW